ncbi:transposase [Alicyclobacillus sp. SO9]|nr:transposase [Alicyclobacillus sp. SO9]
MKVQPQRDNLFTNEQFHYNSDQQQVVCPGAKTTYRSTYLKEFKGRQFYFCREDCRSCPLRAECTTAKSGRTILFRRPLGTHSGGETIQSNGR